MYNSFEIMRASVSVHDGIIPWIRSIADPDAVRANENELLQWEEGKRPTLKQIDEMSRQLMVPFGYFLLSQPIAVEQDSPAFRTLGSMLKHDMSPNLRDTVGRMEAIQDWLRDEAEEVELDRCPIAAILNGQSVMEAASLLRKELHLDVDWYRSVSIDKAYDHIRSIAGKRQVFIFESGIVSDNTHRVLSLDEFRGFALYDSIVPLIFINSRDNVRAKAFTLLHELVHIAKGSDDLMRGVDEESFCNRVAAEIMVPEAELREFWAAQNLISKASSLDAVASRFRCSKSVAVHRTYSLGLISSDVRDEVLSTISNAIAKRKAGGNYYNTKAARLDHNFLNMLRASLQEGRTRYTDAFRLTGCWGSKYDKLMAQVTE